MLSDSQTLTHILNPVGYKVDGNKNMLDRISRWVLKFGGYRYWIEHIDGVSNHFCDMVSRWGIHSEN